MTERRQASFANTPEDETWFDFLQSAGATAGSSSSTNNRPLLPAIETARKRRLTSAEQGRNYPYSAPGSNRNTPIDLTSPSRHRTLPPRRFNNFNNAPWLQQRPTAWGSMAERRPSDMPPPWQPDAQVAKCPVCETDFSFLYRKHHCRKCGRVVCSACSPHRITIPKEYIVQPPGMPIDNGGGAEVVRVCKPCVPDPWTPQVPQIPQRRPSLPQGLTSQPPPRPTMPTDVYQERHVRRASELSQSRYHTSRPHNLTISRPRSSTIATPPRPGQSTTASARFIPGHTPRDIPPPPPPRQPERPRRQVREEDECPVCGIELPPGDAVRETHITDCVTSRFSTPPTQPVRDPSLPSASTPPIDRARANSYRSRGLIAYLATEKDAVDHEGKEQECTICMEEFAAGDEMGRLECLCKFHKKCIKDWWKHKGSGSCPVHVGNT